MCLCDAAASTSRLLLRRALDRADAKTVPILATTAEAFEQEKEEILSAGMNGHLAKPIDPQKLYELLGQFL